MSKQVLHTTHVETERERAPLPPTQTRRRAPTQRVDVANRLPAAAANDLGKLHDETGLNAGHPHDRSPISSVVCGGGGFLSVMRAPITVGQKIQR